MRKAVIIHDTFMESEHLCDWFLQNAGLRTTDPAIIEECISKLKYGAAYASRKRKWRLKKVQEALGLRDDQVEIIDSPHNRIGDDDRVFISAQDASEGKRFLRYHDGQLLIFEGKGNEDWNCAAPNSVYSDCNHPSCQAQEPVTNERYQKDVAPTGTLVEVCESLTL